MNQFKFEGKLKTTFLIMMLIGVISMVMTFIGDDEFHSRFWSNFLHNSVFFTGIGMMALFMLCAKITAFAGWHTVFKRTWEAYSLFLIVGLVLMLIVAAGIWGGWHHLYHWADAESVATDPILQGKSGFLNKGWYTFGTLILVGVWILIATRIRSLSKKEDESGDSTFGHHKKMRIWAAAGLPILGFTSAAMIWQWVMSVDAHWYSTLFAWYNAASMMVAMVAFTILCLIYLKSKGYLVRMTEEHLHDLGKYMFAFSIFWTYLWFSQYMLIWYGNVGEETIYFKERLDNHRVLFFMNLGINFFLPFFVLMRNDTKKKYGTLIFASLFLIFGHWLDFFLMLKPGILHTTHELAAHGAEAAGHAGHSFTAGFCLPGFLEIGTLIGFTGLFLYAFFYNLTKANLVPTRDPYLMESVHHHV
jgi:hypothetical protein